MILVSSVFTPDGLPALIVNWLAYSSLFKYELRLILHPILTGSIFSTIKSVFRSWSSSTGGSPIRYNPRICLISGRNLSDHLLSVFQLEFLLFVSILVKSLSFFSAKDVYPWTWGYFPYNFIKDFRFPGMLPDLPCEI